MKSIIWFRNDLRIDDNPAMRAACDNSAEVQAVFLYSKEQLRKHNESNVKIDFLIKNLKYHLICKNKLILVSYSVLLNKIKF